MRDEWCDHCCSVVDTALFCGLGANFVSSSVKRQSLRAKLRCTHPPGLLRLLGRSLASAVRGVVAHLESRLHSWSVLLYSPPILPRPNIRSVEAGCSGCPQGHLVWRQERAPILEVRRQLQRHPPALSERHHAVPFSTRFHPSRAASTTAKSWGKPFLKK